MCFDHKVKYKCGCEVFRFTELCNNADRRGKPCSHGDGKDNAPPGEEHNWKDKPLFGEPIDGKCSNCDPAQKAKNREADRAFKKTRDDEKARRKAATALLKARRDSEAAKKASAPPSTEPAANKSAVPSSSKNPATTAKAQERPKAPSVATAATQARRPSAPAPAKAQQPPAIPGPPKPSTNIQDAAMKPARKAPPIPQTSNAQTNASKPRSSSQLQSAPANEKKSIGGQRGGAITDEERDEFGIPKELSMRGGASNAPSQYPSRSVRQTERPPGGSQAPSVRPGASQAPRITIQEPTQPGQSRAANSVRGSVQPTNAQFFPAQDTVVRNGAPIASSTRSVAQQGSVRGQSVANTQTRGTNNWTGPSEVDGASVQRGTVQSRGASLQPRDASQQPSTNNPSASVNPFAGGQTVGGTLMPPRWQDFLPLTLQNGNQSDPAVAAQVARAKKHYSKLFGMYEGEVQRALEQADGRDAAMVDRKILEEVMRLSAERFKLEAMQGPADFEGEDATMKAAMDRSVATAQGEQQQRTWENTVRGDNGSSATMTGTLTTRTKVVPVERTVAGSSKPPGSSKCPPGTVKPCNTTVKPDASQCKPDPCSTVRSSASQCPPSTSSRSVANQCQPQCPPGASVKGGTSRLENLQTVKVGESAGLSVAPNQGASSRSVAGSSKNPQSSQSPANCDSAARTSSQSVGTSATSTTQKQGTTAPKPASNSVSTSKAPPATSDTTRRSTTSPSTSPSTSSQRPNPATTTTPRHAGVSRAPTLATLPEESSQAPSTISKAPSAATTTGAAGGTLKTPQSHSDRSLAQLPHMSGGLRGDATKTNTSTNTSTSTPRTQSASLAPNMAGSRRPANAAAGPAGAAAESRRNAAAGGVGSGGTAATGGMESKRTAGGGSVASGVGESKRLTAEEKGKGRGA
ncbi:MAG: hypothetical protein M1828_003064 [Chrysothrix sp. TS-e1954]|nr:MAG: hypothetical protein M1828_003064 [Chrysothrix sp. TS-e1954]